MSFDCRIRFLEPVDPRLVWAAAMDAVNAPEGYRYTTAPAGTYSLPNPSFCADHGQGAEALLVLQYGHEGSRLVGDFPEGNPPPAYAELRMTSIGADSAYFDGARRAVQGWSPVPTAWSDDDHPWN